MLRSAEVKPLFYRFVLISSEIRISFVAFFVYYFFLIFVTFVYFFCYFFVYFFVTFFRSLLSVLVL